MNGLDWSELVVLAIGVVGAGAAAGLIAGLLGVGGGIVAVPVLYAALEVLGVPESVRAHIAVGTSLACIVPTAIVSIRAHAARGAVDVALVRRFGIFIVLGAVLGTWVAAGLKGPALAAIFGALALVAAIQMVATPENTHLRDRLPPDPVTAAITGLIGTLSAIMGIGGGTFAVPFLSLCSFPIRRAVGTASAFGLLIAVPGAIGFIVTGWNLPDRPAGSLGYVSLIGLALMVPTTILCTPLGARLAHGIPPVWLRRAFALFLGIAGGRMLLNALA